jgi:hypothetical protein
MKRSTVAAVTVLALLAVPAFAQTSVTTESSRTVTAPAPPPPTEPPAIVIVPGTPAPAPSSSYESHSVTHSTNGIDSRTSRSDEYVSPDGSTTSRSKVIERDQR